MLAGMVGRRDDAVDIVEVDFARAEKLRVFVAEPLQLDRI